MNKITLTPADEALFAFDAENNVEPARTIAERIAAQYGVHSSAPIVDGISHAIEDAMRLGERRGLLLP